MTDKITTTLKQIRKARPCGLKRGSGEGYDKLRKFLGKGYGDDTPITFRQIYESNGYDDTLWCLRTVDPKWFPLWRHFAVDCAEDVKHLMTDERSLNALVVAREHADGKASDEELAGAWDAAWDAARDSARAAARASAWSSAWDAARDSARAAARASAWSSAWDVAWSSAWDVARASAWDVARASAWDVAIDSQMNRLFEYCRTGNRVMRKGDKK